MKSNKRTLITTLLLVVSVFFGSSFLNVFYQEETYASPYRGCGDFLWIKGDEQCLKDRSEGKIWMDTASCGQILDSSLANGVDIRTAELKGCIAAAMHTGNKGFCIVAPGGTYLGLPVKKEIFGYDLCNKGKGDPDENTTIFKNETKKPFYLGDVTWDRGPDIGSEQFKVVAKLQSLTDYKERMIKNAMNYLNNNGLIDKNKLNQLAKDGKVDVNVTEESKKTAENTNNSDYPKSLSESNGEHVSCKIKFFGYILCPIFQMMVDTSTALNKAISSLLSLSDSKGLAILDQAGSGKAVYEAWKVFRDIANVAFVVIFLAIIISQMTGFGISNYGIKTMLPKLIVGAILINGSFFICQASVDVSNIVGNSINSFVRTATGKSSSSGDEIGDKINRVGNKITNEDEKAQTNWVGTAVAAGGVIYVIIAFGGAIFAVLLCALLFIYFLLVLRKALVILLVALSPIAFVSYIIQGDGSGTLFKRWFSMFKWQLMLFPVVNLLWGLSVAVANVIGSGGGFFEGMSALVVLALPAFSIIPLMTASMTAGGGAISSAMSKITGQAQSLQASGANRLSSSLNKRANMSKNIQRAAIASGTAEALGRHRFVSRGRARLNRTLHDAFGGEVKQQADRTRERLLGDRLEREKTEREKYNIGSNLSGEQKPDAKEDKNA